MKKSPLQYRCAIIGCGGRGRMHALAYQHVSRGELVACCDRNGENLERFTQEFQLNGYNSMREMIEKEKPDLIHLVTSPKERVELMTLVSEMGVPACIVEKPVALEVQDWKALVSLEQHSRTKFAVGAQFRYHPDLNRCRDAVQSGNSGKET